MLFRRKPKTALNVDGQPLLKFNWHANLKKNLEHLLGLCRGLVADNKLTPDEVVFLDAWLKNHPELDDTWPGQMLKERLAAILADNVVDHDEAEDLKHTIEVLIGGGIESGAPSGGAALPVDKGATVAVAGASFCLTGKFLYGARRKCERAIEDSGGIVTGSVTRKLNYLVVGSLASRDWAHTSFGRKIDRALSHKNKGYPILIIEEEEWAKALRETTPA